MSMLAGWLVPGHLAPGRLTASRLRNCRDVSVSWLVPGSFPGSWAAGSRMSDGGELHEWARVGAGCARPFGTCCVCARSQRSPHWTVRSTWLRESSGSVRPDRPGSCRAGLPKYSSCRPFVQPCCVGSSVSVRRARNTLPRRGPASTCCAEYLQLLRRVLAVPGRQYSSGQSAQRSPRGRPLRGSLNAPDWLAGQHADRAWPTRRRGIRMPWWCWPAGRSPCCSPRQWPPGNESPCPIPRQR